MREPMTEANQPSQRSSPLAMGVLFVVLASCGTSALMDDAGLPDGSANGTDVSTGGVMVTVDPDIVDFGAVRIGETATFSIIIRSDGPADIGLRRGEVFDLPFRFAAPSSFVDAGAPLFIEVTYQPDGVRRSRGVLIIRAPDGEENEVQLMGEGIS